MLPMLALVALGCSNSGLGRDDATNPPDTEDPLVGECPWVGTWDLVDVRCASFPYDDWFASYSSARLDISASESGGCSVARVLILDPGCRETERMTWRSNEEGTEVQVSSDGVSSCTPSGCGFPTVGICEPGARDGTTDTLEISVDDASGLLTLVDDLPDGTFVDGAPPPCTLEVVTDWALR